MTIEQLEDYLKKNIGILDSERQKEISALRDLMNDDNNTPEVREVAKGLIESTIKRLIPIADFVDAWRKLG